MSPHWRVGRKHDEVWILIAPDAPGIAALFLDVAEVEISLNERLQTWAESSESEYEPARVTNSLFG